MDLPLLSEKDLLDLDFACVHADLIGCTNLESATDWQQLIDALVTRNASNLPVITTVTSEKAAKYLPDLLLSTGEQQPFGVLLNQYHLTSFQKPTQLAEMHTAIANLCEAAHVPLQWARCTNKTTNYYAQ